MCTQSFPTSWKMAGIPSTESSDESEKKTEKQVKQESNSSECTNGVDSEDGEYY